MSGRLVARRGGQIAAGVIVAALLAEAGFWVRDRGAFPHLNCYVADATLGVSLRPGATERVSFGGNPVTRVRINADGLRGAELPPPRADELLVVGDSQVFGLGVEEQETFAARLGQLTGRPVVNAGVPTYGPDEYDAKVDELLARRHPTAVVYTVNVANDLFEAERPNRDRHAVWDGWAVRKETAPSSVAGFPGRALLFGRSHAVFALRKAWFQRNAAEADQGVASEGSWQDLVDVGATARQAGAAAHAQVRAENQRRAAAHAEARQQTTTLEDQLAAKVEPFHIEAPDIDENAGVSHLLQVARSSPGDIVLFDYGEGSRAVAVTASMLKLAGEYRRKVEQQLGERRRERKAATALTTLATWEQQAAKLKTLASTPARRLRHSSPLLPHLERMKALCDARGARLVVLVLPLDVMVSGAEWAKYGAPALEMAPARILVDDLVRASEERGVSALDVTAALAAAEPGAFLNRDLHMTPKGHDAVARALAVTLAEPASFPTGALPEGRTELPFANPSFEGGTNLLAKNGKLNDQGDCGGWRFKDWVQVVCVNRGRKLASPILPRGVKVVEGGRGDAMTFTAPQGMMVLAPVPAGDRLAVDFVWPEKVVRLVVSDDGLAYLPPRPVAAEDPAGPSALEAKLLTCLDPKGSWRGHEIPQLGADADCARTYGDDCERLLECARGDPASPPDCPRGFVSIGPLNRCHQRCGPTQPCAHGRCAAWPGGSICE
jgi:hypothetical protein